MNRITKARIRRFYEQGGKCFYCGIDMWERTIEKKHAARWRFGITPGVKGAKWELGKRMCTGEHLVRKVDHGSNSLMNIVAACADCNHTRGETSVAAHKAAMEGEGAQP